MFKIKLIKLKINSRINIKNNHYRQKKKHKIFLTFLNLKKITSIAKFKIQNKIFNNMLKFKFQMKFKNYNKTQINKYQNKKI